MPLRFAEVVDRPLFATRAFSWRLGLRSLTDELWLQPDDARERDLAEKHALLTARSHEVLAWLPGSEAPAAEVAALVAADLRGRGLALASGGDHPIDAAGRSVQEDLCLMERRSGSWILTAGSVCFPTRWALRDKIGGSLASIHEPVPGYGRDLALRVERFFDRMAAGSLAWRLNWSLVGEPSRRLEARDRQAPPTPPADLGRDLFVRVERQTLRRLVGHDAIVFGIRIHVWPLEEVVDLLPPEGLATALESMPIDVATYKNIDGVRRALVAWLASDRP